MHDSVDEAEFDSPETVESIALALEANGYIVERVEVSGSPADLSARLDEVAPALIFNTAEGRRGRWREAFYPSLFEELGIPYTGAGPHTLMVTLDKELTKRVVAEFGIDVARGCVVTAADLAEGWQPARFAFPVIVKPNFEGSSKGINEDAVAGSPRELRGILDRCLSQFSEGALVEEFITGKDVAVPFLEGATVDGILEPVEYTIDPSYARRYDIYDYKLKNELSHLVHVRCPADLPRDVIARLRVLSKAVVRALRLEDIGRIDYRIGNDGRIYFIEANALPSLEPGASVFESASLLGLDYNDTIDAIVQSAAKRAGLKPPPRKRQKPPLRVGFCFNVKRQEATSESDDDEAEFDSPKTIAAIQGALASLGFLVVPLEASPDLPRRLVDEHVDVVFNIAEGVGTGRGREAQTPALCELVGIPCTGSDAAALAVALDKALTKRILRHHEIPTPEFQIFHSVKERLQRPLRYPVIVKPNAEGSSKGIGRKAICDTEDELRLAVADVIARYRQPALAEEYITGREFTVGILGDRRPRVLPPMEIVFTDPHDSRPVYDFAIKQEWDKHVEYVCPAQITSAQRRAIDRVARDTFDALGCRDVGRVDIRVTDDGVVYVLEINPLPGLTPGYSDLVLIAEAASMDYRSLVSEILAGALRRLRQQSRDRRRGRSAKAT